VGSANADSNGDSHQFTHGDSDADWHANDYSHTNRFAIPGNRYRFANNDLDMGADANPDANPDRLANARSVARRRRTGTIILVGLFTLLIIGRMTGRWRSSEESE